MGEDEKGPGPSLGLGTQQPAILTDQEGEGRFSERELQAPADPSPLAKAAQAGRRAAGIWAQAVDLSLSSSCCPPAPKTEKCRIWAMGCLTGATAGLWLRTARLDPDS